LTSEPLIGEQIIEGVINPEKSEAAEDFEKVEVIVQHDKISWNANEQYIQTSITFM
jgi:hypothetical protein